MSNYQGRLEDSQENKLLVTPHSMANIEDSDTASQIYTVGNMLVFNNRLCKVTAAIAQGDTLEIGTNIAYKGINDIGQQLCASDGKEFYFDVKDGTYGYYPSAAKVASEFVPIGGTGGAAFGLGEVYGSSDTISFVDKDKNPISDISSYDYLIIAFDGYDNAGPTLIIDGVTTTYSNVLISRSFSPAGYTDTIKFYIVPLSNAQQIRVSYGYGHGFHIYCILI